MHSIPLVAAAILFIILHRRHIKKQRKEDANDPHASLDFGMGEVGRSGGGGEKSMRHHQLSLDMNMANPYLLPPELHASRESLNSLSRTMHENEDPYRPVSRGLAGDAMSIRSAKRGDGASMYTTASTVGSKFQPEVSVTEFLPAHPGSKGTPYAPPPRKSSHIGGPDGSAAKNPFDSPVEPHSEDALPANPLPNDASPYPAQPPQAHLAMPANDIARKGLPTSPKPTLPAAQTAEIVDDDYVSNVGDVDDRKSEGFLGPFADPQEPSRSMKQSHDSESASHGQNAVPSILRTPHHEPLPPIDTSGGFMDDESEYGDGFKVTPPSPKEATEEQVRGQRYSMDVPPEEFANAGLGAPGFDARRISLGFRPLPPEAAMDHDDPEVRANRIRSFYKEYFDDSKPAPQGHYYEDYDQNYLGDSADYVMPFAQPVGRRAMTPPPRAPRFRGPPPRAMHGSMSGMGPGGRGPRGFHPPSFGSEGPRPYSSASNRMGLPGPRKPMPPPADLTTLPTPSKLKDDTFALMGAIDFAPPTKIRDQATGRSESPFGERRPYSPSVPAYKPLVSAFDELAPIPSP